MIVGDLLEFDLRHQVFRNEDYVILEVADAAEGKAVCRWHLDAGRSEVAVALRRLADRLEDKL